MTVPSSDEPGIAHLTQELLSSRQGIDLRLYELCRNHCGYRPKWEINIDTLYKKTGTQDALRNFRLVVKKLAEENDLPGYRLRFRRKQDKLTGYSTVPKGSLREFNDRLSESG